MGITLQFLIITFIIEVTPGPSVLFVLFQSAFGFRYALMGILGLLSSNLIWISLVATGLGLVITQSPLLFDVLRWCGAIYLAYLGFNILRHGIKQNKDLKNRKEKSLMRVYLHGLLTSLSNPKALIYFLALFPNFTRADHFITDIVYFGGLKMFTLLVVMSLYALLGQRIFDTIQSSQIAQIISRSLGAGIIIAAILIVRN